MSNNRGRRGGRSALKDIEASAVIQKVMDQLQFPRDKLFTVKTTAKSWHLIDVPGTGKFDCEECERHWISCYSWVRLNLKTAAIQKWWMMKCAVCKKECEPKFEEKSLIRMATMAIQFYRGTYASSKQADPHKKPFTSFCLHSNVLCQKCGYSPKGHCYKGRLLQVVSEE